MWRWSQYAQDMQTGDIAGVPSDQPEVRTKHILEPKPKVHPEFLLTPFRIRPPCQVHDKLLEHTARTGQTIASYHGALPMEVERSPVVRDEAWLAELEPVQFHGMWVVRAAGDESGGELEGRGRRLIRMWKGREV